jgi:hypothetical protein
VVGSLVDCCFVADDYEAEKRGQMKIMQMAFMIVGVFIFFVIVGLFVLVISFNNTRGSAEDLAREEAISFLGTIASLSEFSYDSDESYCVDEDKLKVLTGGFGNAYEEFWPVASIEVCVLYPNVGEVIECPGEGCNYYDVYDSGQVNVEKYSSYVSVCQRVKEYGTAYDDCSVGKLIVGVELNEN